jgi:hypothetical protein
VGGDEERSPAKRAIGAVTGLAGVITAIVAIIGGSLALLGYLKKDSPPSKAVSGGKITNVTFSPLSFGGWARRLGQAPTTHSAQRRRQPGLLVYYDVRLDGAVNEQLPLHWILSDVRGHDLDHRENLFLVPEAISDRNSKQLWVPLKPKLRGVVRLDIEIYNPRGTEIIVHGCGTTTVGARSPGASAAPSGGC